MPVVGPDDPARDLPWLWLGPKQVRLPAAPIAAYGMFFGLWGMASMVAFVSVATPRQWVIATAVTLPVALIVTKLIFKHVDSVRNLRYHRDMLAHEIRAPRPPIDPGERAAGEEHRLSPAAFVRRKDTL